jgi:methionine-S-sulfoxide reductase
MKKRFMAMGWMALSVLLIQNAGFAAGFEKATFAGGCFGCLEPVFVQTAGVVKVTAGYMGGSDKNPTPETFADSGYVESAQILYDPAKISYSQLLDVFWKQIDPSGDRNPEYRSIIFYQNPGQKKLAERSAMALKKAGRYSKSVITEILPATEFHEAEEDHQTFSIKNPLNSKLYRAHPRHAN